ncbi:MAG TPA: hypothetical protein VK775_05150, partial [Chthoniobacterales bacterium]|nr:hypothetical protein [Chthoniobacterales bacterium]
DRLPSLGQTRCSGGRGKPWAGENHPAPRSSIPTKHTAYPAAIVELKAGRVLEEKKEERRVFIDRCSIVIMFWNRITGPSRLHLSRRSWKPLGVPRRQGALLSDLSHPRNPFRCLHGARIRTGIRVKPALRHFGGLGRPGVDGTHGTGQRFRWSEKKYKAYLWQYSRAWDRWCLTVCGATLNS